MSYTILRWLSGIESKAAVSSKMSRFMDSPCLGNANMQRTKQEHKPQGAARINHLSTGKLQMLIRIAAVTMCCVVFGLPALSQSTAATPDEVCKSIGDLAETTMKAKQRGVAMSDVMARIATINTGGALDIMRKMVMDAYAQPDFTAPEYMARQIVGFRSENELSCYQTMQASGDLSASDSITSAPSSAGTDITAAPASALSADECKWLVDAWAAKNYAAAIQKYGAPTHDLLAACQKG